MARAAWGETRKAKGFSVAVYRRMSLMLWVSLILNLILILSCYYFYFKWPDRRFFASDGVSQPVELTPLDGPNMTAKALLPPPPPVDPIPEVNL